MEQPLTAQAIKDEIYRLGADVCGIAAVESFAGAPAGFHPRDIWSETRSVLVFASQLPVTAIDAENIVPYTYVNQVLTQMVDDLSIRICLWLESHTLRAVPIPSDDPYLHWDAERERGQAILSLRHAGNLAGRAGAQHFALESTPGKYAANWRSAYRPGAKSRQTGPVPALSA